MTRKHLFPAGMLCAVLLATLLVPQYVQAQRTNVVIENGVVRVNGKVVPRAEWPEGLILNGVKVRMSLTGSGSTGVFSGSDGKKFKVEGGIIRPFTEKEYREYVARLQERSAGLQERSAELQERSARLREQSNQLVLQSMELLNHAGDAVEIIARPSRPRPPVLAERNTREAALQEAHAAYHTILGTYFESVEQENRQLYQRLLEEWGMENETVQLAFEIRGMAEGDRREDRLRRLRELLEEAFELKQENRRREVSQLESELEALRARLEERERQRERLIDARIRDLLEESQ